MDNNSQISFKFENYNWNWIDPGIALVVDFQLKKYFFLHCSQGCIVPSLDKSQCPAVSAHIHQYVL